MNKNNRIIRSVLIIGLAALACNLPSGAATEAPVGEASHTFTPIVLDAASPTPTPTVAVATQCSPIITTNTDANVRSGPDSAVYGIVGVIPQGGTAPVAGRNSNGTWWYIQFAGGSGGYAWIAGSVTTATCIPSTLVVIAAPPTPVIPPTNTPVPTVIPSATSTPPPTSTSTPIFFPFPTFDIPCFPPFGC